MLWSKQYARELQRCDGTDVKAEFLPSSCRGP